MGETEVKSLYSKDNSANKCRSTDWNSMQGQRTRISHNQELTGIWFKGTSTCPRKSSRVWRKRGKGSHIGDRTHKQRNRHMPLNHLSRYETHWHIRTGICKVYFVLSMRVNSSQTRDHNNRLFPFFKQGESFCLNYFCIGSVWSADRCWCCAVPNERLHCVTAQKTAKTQGIQFLFNKCLLLLRSWGQRTEGISHCSGRLWDQINTLGRSDCPTAALCVFLNKYRQKACFVLPCSFNSVKEIS